MANPNLTSNSRHVKLDARICELGGAYPPLVFAFKGEEITVTYGRKFPIGSKHVVKDIFFYDAIGPNGYGGQEVVYFVTTNDDKIASHNCDWDRENIAEKVRLYYEIKNAESDRGVLHDPFTGRTYSKN